MDVKKLIRDPERVLSQLVTMDDNRTVTTKELKIHVPSRHAEKELASLGKETVISGMCGYIAEDKYYGATMVNALMRISPTSTTKIVIDDVEYLEFYFEPGATVIRSMDLFKLDTIVYPIYDVFVSKCVIPWYYDYENLSNTFKTAVKYAGAPIGQNKETTELVFSMLARDPKNRTVYWRHAVNKDPSRIKERPDYIPLRSVTYTATNTIAKLVGSYFQEGLTAALVNPTVKTERIEKLLRMPS